jgi:hypothetical protein
MSWRISPIYVIGFLGILAVNIWLLALVAIEMVSDNQSVADRVDWNPGLSASVASAVSRRPIGAYGQILARPVFSKSRQPFVPPPTPPSPVSMPASLTAIIDPGLVLGGIMINSGVRKAYVFGKTGAAGTWTSEGDDFMGWRVRSISGTGAKLEQQGRSIDLLLYPRE